MSKNFRPPAVPLALANPDFSFWSFSDKLTEDTIRHWCGTKNNILGIIEVDESLYRFMGVAYSDNFFAEDRFDIMEQTSCKVTPMQTIYEFECPEVRLKLTFTSPLFMDNLDILSTPVSYVDYEVLSNDGKPHRIKISFMLNAEIGGNTPEGKNVSIVLNSDSRFTIGAGSDGLLARTYDMETAGCGYFTLVSGEDGGETFVTNTDRIHYSAYTWTGFKIDELVIDNPHVVKSSSGHYAGWKKEYNLDKSDFVKGFVCLGYDDIYALEYLDRKIKLYCYRNGDTFEDILKKSVDEHDEIVKKAALDSDKILSMAKSVSDEYADIISLAYRQVIAGHKLTWCDDEIQFFSKECASNGCVATVDITYPSIPMFLLFNPKLAEGMLNPIMKFASSDRWPFEFAPHDLGQYPKANRQVYGCKSERTSKEHLADPNNRDDFIYTWQMPVEESGNLIICIAAMCKALGDYTYAKKHFDLLQKWADYLLKCGFDPENQLCTDDFAGHLAHNCNLSVKAIIAIACFGHICENLDMDGKMYYDSAKVYANDWKIHADDGEHYRLAFDKEGTWSLKYNLIWDKLFDFNLFGDEVIEKETSKYLDVMLKYGVPLDNRSPQGKTDWQLWASALKPGSDYEKAMISKMHSFLCESPSRAPFTDWLNCETGKKYVFQNRTVQGGLFINLLARDDRFSNQ